MKLKYLTLNKIVDAAYLCGIDETPVSILMALPPGSGKTWSTKSIQDCDFVMYLSKIYSPNEHRAVIGKNAARTRLLINDDLGFSARWNQKEFFSTFCMIVDGEIMYTVYRQTQHAATNCSLLLVCTLDYYYASRGDMVEIGLFDRVIPLTLRLSPETRRMYQKSIIADEDGEKVVKPRIPELIDKGPVQRELIERMDIDPRLLRNMKFISQYLTEEEFKEMIDVAHSNGKYEI
jgi:hypothetical protein